MGWRAHKENGMTKQKMQKILETYDLYDDDDVSTERLLMMVADECRCGVEDVVHALMMAEDAKGD